MTKYPYKTLCLWVLLIAVSVFLVFPHSAGAIRNPREIFAGIKTNINDFITAVPIVITIIAFVAIPLTGGASLALVASNLATGVVSAFTTAAGIGSLVVGAAGSIIGAKIGCEHGEVGCAVGTAVGGFAGSALGSNLGEKFGNYVSGLGFRSDEAIQLAQQQVNTSNVQSRYNALKEIGLDLPDLDFSKLNQAELNNLVGALDTLSTTQAQYASQLVSFNNIDGQYDQLIPNLQNAGNAVDHALELMRGSAEILENYTGAGYMGGVTNIHLTGDDLIANAKLRLQSLAELVNTGEIPEANFGVFSESITAYQNALETQNNLVTQQQSIFAARSQALDVLNASRAGLFDSASYANAVIQAGGGSVVFDSGGVIIPTPTASGNGVNTVAVQNVSGSWRPAIDLPSASATDLSVFASSFLNAGLSGMTLGSALCNSGLFGCGPLDNNSSLLTSSLGGEQSCKATSKLTFYDVTQFKGREYSNVVLYRATYPYDSTGAILDQLSDTFREHSHSGGPANYYGPGLFNGQSPSIPGNSERYFTTSGGTHELLYNWLNLEDYYPLDYRLPVPIATKPYNEVCTGIENGAVKCEIEDPAVPFNSYLVYMAKIEGRFYPVEGGITITGLNRSDYYDIKPITTRSVRGGAETYRPTGGTGELRSEYADCVVAPLAANLERSRAYGATGSSRPGGGVFNSFDPALLRTPLHTLMCPDKFEVKASASSIGTYFKPLQLTAGGDYYRPFFSAPNLKPQYSSMGCTVKLSDDLPIGRLHPSKLSESLTLATVTCPRTVERKIHMSRSASEIAFYPDVANDAYPMGTILQVGANAATEEESCPKPAPKADLQVKAKNNDHDDIKPEEVLEQFSDTPIQIDSRRPVLLKWTSQGVTDCTVTALTIDGHDVFASGYDAGAKVLAVPDDINEQAKIRGTNSYASRLNFSGHSGVKNIKNLTKGTTFTLKCSVPTQPISSSGINQAFAQGAPQFIEDTVTVNVGSSIVPQIPPGSTGGGGNPPGGPPGGGGGNPPGGSTGNGGGVVPPPEPIIKEVNP